MFTFKREIADTSLKAETKVISLPDRSRGSWMMLGKKQGFRRRGQVK
jgi:hypothetical protein